MYYHQTTTEVDSKKACFLTNICVYNTQCHLFKEILYYVLNAEPISLALAVLTQVLRADLVG
jgi:hypothetical protein